MRYMFLRLFLKDEIPYELRSSRTYWSYINPQNFLAETNMAYDVLYTLSERIIIVIQIESSLDSQRYFIYC